MLTHDILRTILYGAVAVVLVLVIAYVYEPPAQRPISEGPLASQPIEDQFALSEPMNQNTPPVAPVPASPSVELKIDDITVGTGLEIKHGKRAVVHYTGTLADGTKFDSSLDRGEPFVFTLGAGEVIKGWDYGVIGMKVGGKRKLTIPPELGYGSRAVGPIPANSTLTFEVELLEIR
ncbi:MAG: FKBP-type peptidyl-prolyl cis-trans isomerase [Patescibacteria group bacterium]